jgi:Ion channel
MNEEETPSASAQILPAGELAGSERPDGEIPSGELRGGDPPGSKLPDSERLERPGEEKSPESAAQRPEAHPARAPRPIRRVPKPRMTGLLDSPVRNLTVGVIYTIGVMVAATIAYMAVGWSFRDALYMVIITTYTVGFGEVRPIITIALIVLGCTGIIFLTGALVQFITLSQINKVRGSSA